MTSDDGPPARRAGLRPRRGTGPNRVVLYGKAPRRGPATVNSCAAGGSLERSARSFGLNPRVEWFDRRNISKLADSFAEFMDSLRPLDDDAGASRS